MERGVGTGTRTEADQVTLSAGMSHRAITERILELAGRAGYKAALIDAVAGTVTGWPRFAWTIRAAAHGLRRRGLADGDTAAVFVQDAASFTIAVNAVRAAGATALPIWPDTALADAAAQLNAGGARLLITAAPLAELAAEAADRSRVRQVFTFGEAAGTTSFRSLLDAGKHEADGQVAEVSGPPDDADPPAADGLSCLDGPAGLSYRDVVIAAPPCGQGQAYTALLDLTLLTMATIVAAPVPLVAAAMRVYHGTAAIVPRGTDVPGISPDRVFAVALSGPRHAIDEDFASGRDSLLLRLEGRSRSRGKPSGPDQRDDHQQAAHVEDGGETEGGRHPVGEHVLRDGQRRKPGRRVTDRLPGRRAVDRDQDAEGAGGQGVAVQHP